MKENKCLMTDDYMLNGVLNKIKTVIGIEKIDDTKILIDTYNKLAYEFTLKKVVILNSCAIKDVDKFYLQKFLEETLAV